MPAISEQARDVFLAAGKGLVVSVLWWSVGIALDYWVWQYVPWARLRREADEAAAKTRLDAALRQQEVALVGRMMADLAGREAEEKERLANVQAAQDKDRKDRLALIEATSKEAGEDDEAWKANDERQMQRNLLKQLTEEQQQQQQQQ